MKAKKLKKFLRYLQKENVIIAPSMEGEELVLKEIKNFDDIELTNEIPLDSFKKFLVPNREVLGSSCSGIPPLTPPCKGGGRVLFGVNAPDLKAITILNHIFEKDPYYQTRMKKLLIVGYVSFPDEFNAPFAVHYEENNLEHFQFDIFIVEDAKTSPYPLLKGGECKVFTGSEDGQRILDDFGYSNYENVQFAGLVKEEGQSASMVKVRAAMGKLTPKSKIFHDLGKKCIECGRCSLICPLCYCFCLDDEVRPPLTPPCKGGGRKERILTTCFYSEFSEVAGGQKFLKNPAERIYNWYEHKFVRFPDELSVPGCVSCGRCAKVCPVGIDIKNVMEGMLSIS